MTMRCKQIALPASLDTNVKSARREREAPDEEREGVSGMAVTLYGASSVLSNSSDFGNVMSTEEPSKHPPPREFCIACKMGIFRTGTPSAAKLFSSGRQSFAARASRYTRMQDEGDWDADASTAEQVWSLVSKRLVTEMIATFFLALLGSQNGIFATSMLLAALTFMAGSESQAHFSPAITLAYVTLRALDLTQALGYILFQTLGALLGLLTAVALFGAESALASSQLPVLTWKSAAVLAAPTLIYSLVHMSVLSQGKRTQYYGLAIGLALYAAVVAHGEASGNACLLNPALSTGSWLASYLVGPPGQPPLIGSGITLATSPVLNLIAFFGLTGGVAAASALLFEVCNGEGRLAVLTTEATGTYLTVLLVVATADEGRETSAQAVGLGYAALTYFGAEISEAHYNPLMTLAHTLAGSMHTSEAPMYARQYPHAANLRLVLATCFFT